MSEVSGRYCIWREAVEAGWLPGWLAPLFVGLSAGEWVVDCLGGWLVVGLFIGLLTWW